MLSTGNITGSRRTIRRDDPWSDGRVILSVAIVPGSDADRALYRRRLGLVLQGARGLFPEYTQAYIGKDLGVDKDTVGKWERGLGDPSAWELHRMAALYSVPPEWLIFPPDSISELEGRLATLRRLLAEAARDAEGDEPDQPSGDGPGAPPGRPPQRKPPRSPR